MLQGEQPEQRQIDCQRFTKGSGDAVVDAAGHADVAKESDRIDERRRERQISHAAVTDDQYTSVHASMLDRADPERMGRLPQFSGETRPCRSAYMLAPIRFDTPIFV